MSNSPLRAALEKAYAQLRPYSNKYKVDFERYLITLTLLSHIPDYQNKTVLDVGTGIGILPLALRNLNIQADGLEHYIFPKHNNAMFGIDDIGILEKIWGEHEMRVWDYDIYSIDQASEIRNREILISEATIEHVRDPKKFLEQCHSLLCPGGYLVVSTPNLSTLLKRIRFIFGRSPYWPIQEFFHDGEQFTGHWREYTLKELRYMCETAGFIVHEAHNRNALTKFKSLKDIRKNIRALVMLLSDLIPGAREMNYVLAQKK